jgi:ABC-type bacteriocin/lantibiotic exporter with double-glycine peptidase domain
MIRHLWSVIRSVDSSRFGLPLFFVSCLTVAILELISVGVIPLFVTVLLKPEALIAFLGKYSGGLFVHGNDRLGTVLTVGIWLMGFLAFKAVAMLILGLLQNRSLAQYQSNLSSRLLSRYLRWPYETHLLKNSAELVRNAVSVPISITTSLLSVSIIATETMLAALATALLVVYQPVITLCSIGLLGATVGILYAVFQKRLATLGKDTNSEAVETTKWINQTLGGLKEIRIAGREHYFHKRYMQHFSEFSRLTLLTQFIVQAPRLFMELLAIGSMIVLAVVLLTYGNPQDVLPTMALFGAASLRLIPSANRIWNAIATVKSNIGYVDTYRAEMSSPTTTPLQQPSTKPLAIDKSIEISDLSYSYSGSSQPALNRIALSIKRGSTVGIAGRSGAGKSTLLDILLGLHAADTGDIKVDNLSIWHDLASWRAMIGYVPQQIFLLDDSIRRNIALGDEDGEIDDVRVMEALRKASLAEFVMGLPHKLDTQLGERGARLSGGQRQRIGIARALYRTPSVLFLDEATSALDHETEQAITATLQELHGEITIVVIAHHAGTMRLCDHIFLLEKGELVASGTPDELKEQNVRFK